MTVRLTRRALIQGLAAGTLLPWWAAMPPARAAAAQQMFGHGVASGDPDASSVVLWTRVSPSAGATRVSWELAEDADFRRVLRRGSTPTDAARDHTVKVLAEGLPAGGTFYYRFNCNTVTSMVGRTRTLPTGAVDTLTLAVASCSNYPFGHFNGYDAIARDQQVDLLLHLGDYIYEYGHDGYGGETGARIGRPHAPAHEIVSLDDYRTRHGQYKSDAGSMLMLAAHPLIAIWDDHESTNNPWMGGAQNHQPAEEGPWPPRRRASLQAYYEWMPIREASTPDERADYWRHFEIGNLASIISLETRHTGRAEQIGYLDHLSEDSLAVDVAAFRRDVLDAAGRRMLPERQEAFIRDALSAAIGARRPWRIIANQIPMARVQVPPLRESVFDRLASDPDHPAHAHWRGLATLGDHDLPIYLDTWDGYPWARQRFYELLDQARVNDALVLTGDSHAFWLNHLHDDNGTPMGVELGTTGITSPGDFAAFGDDLGGRIDTLLAEHNDEVIWTDNIPRGWLRVTLEHDRATAEYMALSNIETTDYTQRIIRTATLRRENGELRIT